MKYQRGFSYLEILVIVGIVSVAASVTVPLVASALSRNRVWTASEAVAGQLRTARLVAISRNQRIRLRFACPVPNSVRVLAVTGNPAIDAASDRCSQNQPNDGPPVYLPDGISLGADAVPTIEFSGRGIASLSAGSPPLSIVVSNDDASRTITVSASGRVSTPTSF
jgi:Tfp pilus assembly protein FimT